MEGFHNASSPSRSGQEGGTDPWCHLSPESRERYRTEWGKFSAFCKERGKNPVPADPGVLVQYIKHLSEERHEPFETIRSKLSIVAGVHGANGCADPRHNSEVLWLLCQVRRLPKANHVKRPLFNEDIRQIVATMARSNRDLRDKSIFLVAYAAAMSPSEIAHFRIEHISPCEEGLILRICQSRPFLLTPAVDVSCCPVRSLRAWFEVTTEFGGHVFHPIRGDRVQPGGISERGVRGILRRRIAEIGLDPNAYSASSLRLGCFLEKIRGGWVPSPGTYAKLTRSPTGENEDPSGGSKT
jgi:hypothetical protein